MRPLNLFVSIPDGFRPLLDNAIKPLHGGRIEMVSFFEHYPTGAFSNAIRRNIKFSNLVIAIVTGNNPNVLYEIGIAIGSNKPLIPIVDDPQHMPSMMRQLHSIRYNPQMPDWGHLKQEVQKLVELHLYGRYGPLRSRTHNEILVRQRFEREILSHDSGSSSQSEQDPIELAITAYEDADYKRVISLLAPFIELGTNRSDAYFFLSDAYFLLGEQTVEAGPKRTLYLKQRDVAELAQQRGLMKKDTYKNLGLANLKLGELDTAEMIFSDLIAKDPTYEVAQYNLACVYAQRGSKFRFRCLEELSDLVSKDGEWRYIARIDPDLDPLWEDDVFQSLLFPTPSPE